LNIRPGLTVYGRPALFTARLPAPFFLLPHLPKLAAGLSYCLANLRGAAHPRKDIEEFTQRLGQNKSFGKLPSFSYAGTLG